MAETGLTVGVMTCVWGFIGIVLPIILQFFLRSSPNRGIIQLCLILTAVCCYLFWLLTFIAQLNPLYGPELESGIIRMIQLEWNSGCKMYSKVMWIKSWDSLATRSFMGEQSQREDLCRGPKL